MRTGIFVCSLLYPCILEQFLAQSMLNINICQANKLMKKALYIGVIQNCMELSIIFI